MITVSLVQPNFRTGGNSFAGYWLPYSVGCVYSYSAFGDFKDQLEINQVIFRREHTDTASDNMIGDDIVLFSNFMWNWEYNKDLAKQLKKKSPETIINILNYKLVFIFKTLASSELYFILFSNMQLKCSIYCS